MNKQQQKIHDSASDKFSSGDELSIESVDDHPQIKCLLFLPWIEKLKELINEISWYVYFEILYLNMLAYKHLKK